MLCLYASPTPTSKPKPKAYPQTLVLVTATLGCSAAKEELAKLRLHGFLCATIVDSFFFSRTWPGKLAGARLHQLCWRVRLEMVWCGRYNPELQMCTGVCSYLPRITSCNFSYVPWVEFCCRLTQTLLLRNCTRDHLCSYLTHFRISCKFQCRHDNVINKTQWNKYH